MEAQKVIVRIPGTQDKRKKSWAKHLTGVDISKSDGHAFDGDFLRQDDRAELAVGSYVLTYDQVGSMKNWAPLVILFEVMADGKLAEIYRYKGGLVEMGWALGCRDAIAKIVTSKKDRPELPAYARILLISKSEFKTGDCNLTGGTYLGDWSGDRVYGFTS